MTKSFESGGIRGERALAEGDVDRLGFGEVAARVAASLVDHASDSGFVIGLDGRWGSGKSSLLHLISAELDRLPPERRPTIVPYRPWLVGSRDALLAVLFNQLVEAMAKVSLAGGDATAETVRRAKKTAETARRFAQAASKAGDLLQAVPGSATAKVTGTLLSAVGKLTGKGESASLSVQKDKLTRSLRELGHRFIVTVDDVDRLEPGEVVEVLRLIRSVADFPNIIYLLCYDGDVLAESVSRGADVSDGAAYLEKIVQLSIMVPQPEPFQLRQWFGDEVVRMTGPLDDEIQARLRLVVDQEGGKRLITPRSVVRTLDSLRFFWPALRSEGVDLPDLVWLLLIKDAAPRFYRWIESYLASATTVATGVGSVSEPGKARDLQELRALLEPSHLEDLQYRHFLAEQLPGLELDYTKDGDGLAIYRPVKDPERDAAIAARRLASPDHYRLYLALIGPGHAITRRQTIDIDEAAEAGSSEVGEAILTLSRETISPDMSKLDLFLERLSAQTLRSWSSEQAGHLLLAMSDRMDEVDRPGFDQAFMLFTTWDRAERLVRPLLRRIEEPSRAAFVRRMFEEGASLGWLTSLFRHETFAHGRHGDQRRAESEWMLSKEQYDEVAAIMIGRFRQQSVEELLARSRPLNMLFAWAQAGDPEGPAELLANAVASDAGLVQVLQAFITRVSSSDREQYEVIHRDNVKSFLDYDAVVARLKGIRASDLSEEDHRKLGRALMALKNNRRQDFDGED